MIMYCKRPYFCQETHSWRTFQFSRCVYMHTSLSLHNKCLCSKYKSWDSVCSGVGNPDARSIFNIFYDPYQQLKEKPPSFPVRFHLACITFITCSYFVCWFILSHNVFQQSPEKRGELLSSDVINVWIKLFIQDMINHNTVHYPIAKVSGILPKFQRHN